MTKFTLSRWTGLLCSLALVLILGVALLLYVATPASAAEVTASGTCGDNLTWELTDNGVLTISGSGAMTDYSSSTQPWYSNRYSITSVVISDGVTSIGACSFYFCSNITSVSLPDSLISLGKSAFAYCSNLNSISIPDGVTAIPDSCFRGAGLISFGCPSGLESIGATAFRGCLNLESIAIPQTVTTIGSRCFYECNNLSYVWFHSEVAPTFGSDLFYQSDNGRSLKAIYVPDYDAYIATYLGSTYADVIYPYGVDPSVATINWDDYFLESIPGEDVFRYAYSIPLNQYDYSSSVRYSVLPGNSSIIQYNQLTKATNALDVREKTENALAVSVLGTFTYSSTNTSSYSSDGVDLICRYYDDTGYFISSETLEIYGGKMPSGDNSLSKEVNLTLPDGAAYVMAWLYVSHSGQTYSSSSSELVFSFDYEPIPVPVDPVVSDDFGGEVNYLRGQAATPLSVTAMVTDDGVLSYQWYYIDSENVDVAIPIDGAIGTSYTPDTRSVGSRYYYCLVTNTLGELTASAVSDYAYITVTRPDLGDGYKIYDYKDYVAGSVVDGSNKTYTITFPMDGIYTELYGGSGSFSFLDWYTGTNIFCDLPSSALADDEYIVRLTFFPLGSGSQYNVMKLRNVAQGIPACLVFIFDPECDFYVADSLLTLYWYDDDMNLLGTTEYDLYEEIDTSSGQVALTANFDFKYPGSAAYFTYSIDFPNFEPEENMDFSLQIITADLVMTFSMMEDISGGIADVGDKVDGVGDKIEQVGGEMIDGIGETNDKLDDLINGSDASQEIVDRVDDTVEDTTSRGEALLDQLESVERPPAQDVVVSVDSWYQNDTEDSYNNIVQIIWSNDIISQMLMLTCSLMLVSYILFGKKA